VSNQVWALCKTSKILPKYLNFGSFGQYR
jgi:hypothetical protein